MNHPGGGFNEIPNRIKRQFFSINMTEPSDRAVENIYGAILDALITSKKYSADILDMKQPLIEATIGVWKQTSGRLLKTPSKFHYSFNIRELARVFQGICRVAQAHTYKVIANSSRRKEKPLPPLFMVGLWRHECKRTFFDKLTNMADKKTFEGILDKVTKERFRDQGFDDDALMTDYLFADFQRDDVLNEVGEVEEDAPFVYEACPDTESIRKKAYSKLEAYNEKYSSK